MTIFNEASLNIVYSITVIFLMIGIGYIAGKLKIIKQELTTDLTKIVFKIAIPCLIIANMVTTYSREMLMTTLALPVFAFITMLLVNLPLGYLFAKIFKIRASHKNQFVYLNFIQNYYYMSIPLAYLLFGDKGVLYVFLYGFVSDMFLWTLGAGLYDTEGKKSSWKQLLNPAIVALVIGFILAMLKIKFPELIISPLKSIGSITTPLAMLITGAIISNVKIHNAKKILLSKDMALVVILKLFIAPAIIVFLTSLVNLDPTVRAIIVIQAAMPSAFSAILFATEYKKDTDYAAAGAILTTIISLVTVPLFLYLIR
ncbi:MAG: AEC family transporter [Candidatus Firestonebacteria bacterium]|nr:AEC family transporter [Candidatus Firestonebacteria bacterium]